MKRCVLLLLLCGCESAPDPRPGDRYVRGDHAYDVLAVDGDRLTYGLTGKDWPPFGQPGGIRETGTVSVATFKRFMRAKEF